MTDSHSSQALIRKAFSAIFSFETAFILYLFAGFYKASDYLAWAPVDLTLLFLVVSVAAGAWVAWRRRFDFSRRAWLLAAAMGLFAGWVLLSLWWAPATQYGKEKAIQFAVLNGWALAGAALIMDGDRRRLTRFYGILLALALLFSLETMHIYLPHRDVRSYFVLGATYQAIGRLVGLGFVIAVAAFFSRTCQGWRRWLCGALSLLYFFVLLFVGARGPFLAAVLALALILALVKGFVRYKLILLAALAIVYLAGTLWLGPSLRTMYRFNVILAHEIGWQVPGLEPTPTPLPSPTPTAKPSATPTAQQEGVQSKPAPASSATPVKPKPTPASSATPAKPKPTPAPSATPVKPKPTPRPRIPTPKQIPNKSVDMREQGFGNAWRLWLRAPLMGAGVGGYAYHYPAGQLRVYPHNMILEILSELGVVGLILWLLMFGIAFWGFVTHGGWRRNLAIIALAFFTFTFLNAMISGDIASNRHLFTALGLLVATSDLWTKHHDRS